MVAAHLVAGRAGSTDLVSSANSANSAYVHGIGLALQVCGIASPGAALLAGAFLPDTGAADAGDAETGDVGDSGDSETGDGSRDSGSDPDMAVTQVDGRQ